MTARIVVFPGGSIPKNADYPFKKVELPWSEALDRFAIAPMNDLELYGEISERDRLQIKRALAFLEKLYRHLSEDEDAEEIFYEVIEPPWGGAA